jgi:hypothetical protein
MAIIELNQSILQHIVFQRLRKFPCSIRHGLPACNVDSPHLQGESVPIVMRHQVSHNFLLLFRLSLNLLMLILSDSFFFCHRRIQNRNVLHFVLILCSH